MGQAAGLGKLLSVGILCYGDHARYSCRAIRSVTETPGLSQRCNVYVGCNACGKQTLAAVRQGLDAGLISAAIESGPNLNKDPMIRLLRDLVDTPYALFLDDDSWVKAGWLESLLEFIRRQDPLDVAGAVHVFQRHERYQRMVERRPWWRGEAYIPEEQRSHIRLVVGGLTLVRAEFLRRHDYPDRAMRMEYGDVMLADLVYQVGGRLLAMPDELLARFVIDDGESRWNPRGSTAQDQPAPAVGSARQISPVEHLREAVAHLRAGRLEEAAAAADQVLHLQPDHPHALHLRGMIASESGRHSLAIVLLQRAAAITDDVPDVHSNLGHLLAKIGRVEEASEHFRRAIALRPDYPDAHNNLGNVLLCQGDRQSAIAAYRRAAQLRPDFFEAHMNLGRATRRCSRVQEAAECFFRAVQIRPGSAEAHSQLAQAYRDLADLPQALSSIDRAITLDPRNPRLHLVRAQMLLMAGNWQAGWREYEWRWHLSEHHAERLRFRQPLWEGEDLAERTLLLHCEQGLGDSIQFIRFAPLLEQRGGRMIVECQPPLKKLLGCLSSRVQVLARGETLPGFDMHLPLMSVPRVLGITPASVPATVPYLQPQPLLVAAWRQRLSSDRTFKVGIAWQGDTKYPDDEGRSMALRFFSSLAQVPGVRLYSLQKIRGTEQIAELAPPLDLVDFGAELDEAAGPFMDTAAVMKSLDLIVTSDTSIAHLAGALAVPVWVALPFSPDWRWMLEREDCPWYPSMRLLRQDRPGDWTGVFQDISRQLTARVQGRGT